MNCIELQTFIISVNQVKSYQQLHSYISQHLNKQYSSLQIFYIDHAHRYTQIESDNDLLSLRYINRENYYMFEVRIHKSKKQIESQLIDETIGNYLDELYSHISQEQAENEAKQAAYSYLSDLYSRIADKQAKIKMRQIQEQQINRYIANLPKLMERSTRNMNTKTVKRSRFSPSKQQRQTNERQNHIDRIINKVLNQMMPLMIKELSNKIVEEIKQDGLKGQRYNVFERYSNPEEL